MRKVVVIGGGAAGVELALAMHHRLAQATMPHAIDFAVVTDAQCLLPDHNRQTRTALERALAQRGIAVYLNSRVTRVETTKAILGDAAEVIASRRHRLGDGSRRAIVARGYRARARRAGLYPHRRAAGIRVESGNFRGGRLRDHRGTPVSEVGRLRGPPGAGARGKSTPRAGRRALGQVPPAAACVGVDQHGKPLRGRDRTAATRWKARGSGAGRITSTASSCGVIAPERTAI